MNGRTLEARAIAGRGALLAHGTGGTSDSGRTTDAWVLLHGFAGRAESWRAVIEAMPAEVGCAALDLPGHGPGGAGEALVPAIDPDALWGAAAEVRFEAIIDALVPAIEACGAALGARPGALGIAGYSLGARVALGLLVRHGALFSRAVLVSGTAGLEDDGERRARAANDARWAAELRAVAEVEDERARGAALEALFDRWEAQPVLARGRVVPPERLAAHRAARRTSAAAGLAQVMAGLGLAAMPSRWGALASLGAPVTLVTGERDGKFTALAEEMRVRAGGAAEHVVVDGAGHDLLLEAPEVIAAVLAARGA